MKMRLSQLAILLILLVIIGSHDSYAQSLDKNGRVLPAISLELQTALDAKAALASPTFTGTPTINGSALLSLPSGTSAGEMMYWNGTAWIVVATTEYEGATLQMIGGVPTWTGGTIPPPSVTNPTTGKIWMDRNLGATQVAASSTDAASYGDLYQWGRGTDGHQIRTSVLTTGQSSSTSPGADFLKGSSNWYTGSNPDDLWKEDGTGVNNPCPSGYRLPTNAEWDAERASWGSNNAAGAMASPLKLPMAGNRFFSDGRLYYVGAYARYWSSTVSTIYSGELQFNGNSANMNTTSHRASASSVRCLKD